MNTTEEYDKYLNEVVDIAQDYTLNNVINAIRNKVLHCCGKEHDNIANKDVQVLDCKLRANNIVCAHPGDFGSTYEQMHAEYYPLIAIAEKNGLLSPTVKDLPPRATAKYPNAQTEAALLTAILESCSNEIMGLDGARKWEQKWEEEKVSILANDFADPYEVKAPEALLQAGFYEGALDEATLKVTIRKEEVRIGNQLLFVQERLNKAFENFKEGEQTLRTLLV